MKIASLVQSGRESGAHLIEATKDESQTILRVFEKFCDQNKNQPKARKLLKEFTSNFQCF